MCSLKIILDAGSTKYDNWISTNYYLFDITNPRDWEFYFSK